MIRKLLVVLLLGTLGCSKIWTPLEKLIDPENTRDCSDRPRGMVLEFPVRSNDDTHGSDLLLCGLIQKVEVCGPGPFDCYTVQPRGNNIASTHVTVQWFHHFQAGTFQLTWAKEAYPAALTVRVYL